MTLKWAVKVLRLWLLRRIEIGHWRIKLCSDWWFDAEHVISSRIIFPLLLSLWCFAKIVFFPCFLFVFSTADDLLVWWTCFVTWTTLVTWSNSCMSFKFRYVIFSVIVLRLWFFLFIIVAFFAICFLVIWITKLLMNDWGRDICPSFFPTRS